MAEEEEVPVPRPLSDFNPGLGIVEGVGALKVLQYIMRDDEVFPQNVRRLVQIVLPLCQAGRDHSRYAGCIKKMAKGDKMTTPERAAQKTYRDWFASTRLKAGQPDLTAEEKARPYAKYFYEGIPQPDPDHFAMMDAPCDPANAIYPEQLNDLLDPGDMDVEIGWCNLPNGAGFIANRIIHPDATAEMVDWWFAWHPLEDLRYRISCGKPELTLPPGVSVPEAAIQGLARHNVKEFTRFRDFLPRIYAEFGGRMEV
jgi:hypothetical protein